MPRKNIFGVETLILDYNGNRFILKKNDNEFGSTYDSRGASNLLITIQKEMQKSEHEIEYNLQKFNITSKANEKIENYKKQKLESKV